MTLFALAFRSLSQGIFLRMAGLYLSSFRWRRQRKTHQCLKQEGETKDNKRQWEGDEGRKGIPTGSATPLQCARPHRRNASGSSAQTNAFLIITSGRGANPAGNGHHTPSVSSSLSLQSTFVDLYHVCPPKIEEGN